MKPARIAERAGVHRITVQRRRPDHAEFITEALLESAGAAVPILDQGTVRDDLYSLLSANADLIDPPSGDAAFAVCSPTRRARPRSKLS